MKKIPNCGQYDPRALEQWLDGLAAEGKLLSGTWGEFDETEPREVRHCLEIAEEADGPDETLRERRAEAGWEYVCRTDNKIFDVWRASVSHRLPRPRATTEGYGYRRALRKLISSWFFALLMPLSLGMMFVVVLLEEELPLFRLLTDWSTAGNLLLLIASLLLAIPADLRDRRDLHRLRRAVRKGESMASVRQHRGLRALQRPVATVLTVIFLAAPILEWLAPLKPGAPPTALEQLAAQEDGIDAYVRRTILFGRVEGFGTGHYAGMLTHGFALFETQYIRCTPRLSFLTAALAAELRTELMGESCEAISLDGTDECWYSVNGSVQYLLLRGGGSVLLLRAPGQEDLRPYAGELAALLRE